MSCKNRAVAAAEEIPGNFATIGLRTPVDAALATLDPSGYFRPQKALLATYQQEAALKMQNLLKRIDTALHRSATLTPDELMEILKRGKVFEMPRGPVVTDVVSTFLLQETAALEMRVGVTLLREVFCLSGRKQLGLWGTLITPSRSQPLLS